MTKTRARPKRAVTRGPHHTVRHRLRRQAHPPSSLPLGWRIFFLISGWILILIGIAGLALPGIQGVLTIAFGAALLSVSSETVYWVLRWAFRRWPRGWRRIERLRRKVFRWIMGDPKQPPPRTGHDATRRGSEPKPGA